MKPASFHYHAPKSFEAALAILAEVAPQDGRVLAGGQTLVPTMALRLSRPTHLVDINGIAGADRLAVQDGVLCIGPCVRHAAFGPGAIPGPLGRLMAAMQRHIAHFPIRERGTFCGSLANADPASEWCLLATTLGAEMVLSHHGGTRRLRADQFLRGIMTTALRPEEMLTEIRFTVLPAETNVGFNEVSRRAGDFAQAMAIATFTLQDGRITAPRIGLGAVESQPRRLPEAEAVLDGQPPSDSRCSKPPPAAALPDLDPMDDDPLSARPRRGCQDPRFDCGR